MKRICLALAIVATGTASAFAADLPVKAPPPMVVAAYDWTGFYGGINAGGEWQSHDWAFNPANPPPAVNQSWTANANSASFGFHAGVQKQWNQFVFGVEGGVNEFINLDWARHAGYGIGAGSEGDTRVKEIFTVGARVGYAWQNWMFYGSGGYATGYVSTRLVSIATQIENPLFATSVRQDGWYAGAGFDYMVWKGVLADMIVGVDYKHYDLGTAHHCNGVGIPCGFVSTNEHDITTSGDIAVARLTFKFNPWRAAPVVAKY